MIETYGRGVYACPNCWVTWLADPNGPFRVKAGAEDIVWANLTASGAYECDCGSQFRALAFGESIPERPSARQSG